MLKTFKCDAQCGTKIYRGAIVFRIETSVCANEIRPTARSPFPTPSRPYNRICKIAHGWRRNFWKRDNTLCTEFGPPDFRTIARSAICLTGLGRIFREKVSEGIVILGPNGRLGTGRFLRTTGSATAGSKTQSFLNRRSGKYVLCLKPCGLYAISISFIGGGGAFRGTGGPA
jgi:hypothetical protein